MKSSLKLVGVLALGLSLSASAWALTLPQKVLPKRTITKDAYANMTVAQKCASTLYGGGATAPAIAELPTATSARKVGAYSNHMWDINKFPVLPKIKFNLNSCSRTSASAGKFTYGCQYTRDSGSETLGIFRTFIAQDCVDCSGKGFIKCTIAGSQFQ